jgi:hypothetical protein
VATSRRSCAADTNFQHLLIENHIFPDGYNYYNNLPATKPANFDAIQERLAESRSSLSPSRRDPSEFEKYQRANATALTEADIMGNVIPLISGTAHNISSKQNLLFTDLALVTGGSTVQLKPDIYDGAPRAQVDVGVQKDLDRVITPSKHIQAPIAPNYFLEAKSSLKLPEEAKRQITHDLAAGARGMSSLQNYKEETPQYDDNAYTIGATYHGAGLMQLYTGHVQPGSAGQTETYVTQVKAFAMTSDADSYYRGVSAFRNSRELAQEFRDNLIQSANSKAQYIEATEEASADPSTQLSPIATEGAAPAVDSSVTSHPSSRYQTRRKRRRPSPSPGKRRMRSSRS